MKIVGKTGKLWLASIDEEEIVRLLGFRSVYSDAYKQQLKQAGCVSRHGEPYNLEGLELSVTDIAEKISDIECSEKKASDTVKTLRALADALETAWPKLTKNEA